MRRSSIQYQLYHLIWQGIDLLLPPHCGGCGRLGSRWCSDCQHNIHVLKNPLCERCGTPLMITGRLCNECRRQPPSFHALRSWTAFEDPIRPALHRLKYRRDLGLGEALVPQLADFFTGLKWDVDLVVPVPLGQGRLRERGYNQIGLIARPFSLALDLEYDPRALLRVRETRSQVGLNRTARQENVDGAFQAILQRVSGRRILLMDDVATTGSTISSCAKALNSSGALDIVALTVARAFFHRDSSQI